MPYDIDSLQKLGTSMERFIRGGPTHAGAAPACSTDLEVIVTILEVAALSLTPVLGSTFTYGRLLQEIRELCGDEIEIDEKDVRIVLAGAKFLEKRGCEYRVAP